MPAYRDRDRLLFYREPGPPNAAILLPPETRATSAGPDGASVLLNDGQLIVFDLDGVAVHLTQHPARPHPDARVAISANGALVIVASDESIVAWREEHPTDLLTPDFLVAITHICCAPAGDSFGYAWLTGQPWSEQGSYGDRLVGVSIFSDGRAADVEHWRARDYDATPVPVFAWTENVLIVSDEQEVWRHAAPRDRQDSFFTAGGRRAEAVHRITAEPAAQIVLSPDGVRTTLTTTDHNLMMVLGERSTTLLMIPDAIGVTDFGGPDEYGMIRHDRSWALVFEP